MKELLSKKRKLDNKIAVLIKKFTEKNNCGYNVNAESKVIKEKINDNEYAVGINISIDSVITN